MKGLEKIRKKIMADADADAKKAGEDAKREAQQIQQKHKKLQDEYKEQFDERTEALVAGLEQKSLAQARLDVKKQYLQERERIIDEMIGDVIGNLDRKDSSYHRFIKGIVEENVPDLSGKIVIMCSKEDEALVKSVAKDATVKPDASLSGGLVLEDSAGKRIDESIGAVLARRRDAIRQEIARIVG